MRATSDFTFSENVADAMKLSAVFDCIATFRRPVVALVKGNSFGGGLGLLSACDIAYGVEGTQCGAPACA
jgi:methylglutaconyl-CoA hydratase